MNKTCSHCHTNVSTEMFNKNKHTSDGLTYWCRVCIKKNSDEQYEKNKEARLAQQKSRQQQHKEEKAAYDKQYRQNNKDILSKQRQLYYQEHKEEKAAKDKERRKRDPLFKLASYLRNRIRDVLKQNSLTKRSRLTEYLGCTLPELKVHLESKFTEGMTWDNQGEWHIDHILPLQPKISLSIEEMYRRCHYTNLQPLWGPDNIKKSNKLL